MEHDDVWRIIDRVVEAAEPKGVRVWANAGDGYQSVEALVARVERLRDRGIRAVQVGRLETLLHGVLNRVRVGVGSN